MDRETNPEAVPKLSATQIATLRHIFDGSEMSNVRVLRTDEEMREALEDARNAWERLYRAATGSEPSPTDLKRWYARFDPDGRFHG